MGYFLDLIWSGNIKISFCVQSLTDDSNHILIKIV